MSEYCIQLETFLNADQELKRRLAGFKTFSGTPDRHYHRAREQGISAVARAVKCYPFGGKSLLGDGNMIGISILDGGKRSTIVIGKENRAFSVSTGEVDNVHLKLELAADLFWRTVLGRYRWLYVFAMDGVKVDCASHLPHSDWVTLLEMLVAMQELVEFEPNLWAEIESKMS